MAVDEHYEKNNKTILQMVTMMILTAAVIIDDNNNDPDHRIDKSINQYYHFNDNINDNVFVFYKIEQTI